MQKQKINLFVLWFLDTNGSGKELTGGMERYCRDLARLLVSTGYVVHIYQKSSVAFDIDYEPGIKVTGIPAALTIKGHFAYYSYVRKVVPNDEPVIYVSQDLCLSGYFKNAIAVNHGIWWHGDFSWARKKIIRWHQGKMIEWLKAIICVDTNYINWLHAEFANRSLWRYKLKYVCNYADGDIFFACKENKKNKDSLSIVFPRRMMGESIEDEPRGGLILLKALKEFKLRNPRIKFDVQMVGRGALVEKLMVWCHENGLENNVYFFTASFDEMPDVYRKADIVVVPSTGTEGTSLSAIEGVCSGATVVVSHIGGLANVVIDGLNGYVADLSVVSLCEALERAAQEPINFSSANALSKQRWDSKIIKILKNNIEAGL